jgi:Haem-binding domain
LKGDIVALFLCRKTGLIVVGVLAVLVLLMQVVPASRTNPPVDSEISVPAEVKVILTKACYDCHSHETKWPWYSKIAPLSWLISSDVEEGRKELNFSSWSSYSEARKAKKLKEIREELREGEMPPFMYVLMHREAALSTTELEVLNHWIEEQQP